MITKLMTVKELCDLLGVNTARGYELARLWEQSEGKQGIPCIRLGERQLRFSQTAVENHLVFLEGRFQSNPEVQNNEQK